MSVMTDVRSVAANASVENILAGKLHEFLPEASIVTVAVAAAAVGMFASCLIGGESVVNDQEVSDSNRFPISPDDIFVQGAGFGGDRLLVGLRNSTAGAIVVKTQVTIEPA